MRLAAHSVQISALLFHEGVGIAKTISSLCFSLFLKTCNWTLTDHIKPGLVSQSGLIITQQPLQVMLMSGPRAHNQAIYMQSLL